MIIFILMYLKMIHQVLLKYTKNYIIFFPNSLLDIVWSTYIPRSRLNDFYFEIHFMLASCEIQTSNCGKWIQDPFTDTVQGKTVWIYGEKNLFVWAARAFCLVGELPERFLIGHVCCKETSHCCMLA